jgi:hypothetical protein
VTDIIVTYYTPRAHISHITFVNTPKAM